MTQRFDMDEYCGRFRLVADMNGDLAVTVSDVGLWVKFAFLLPSKLVTSLAHRADGLAQFFEVNCATGDGWGGGVFSLLVWLIAWAFFAARRDRK